MKAIAGRSSLRWAWLLSTTILGCSTPPDEDASQGAQVPSPSAGMSVVEAPALPCAMGATCAPASTAPPLARGSCAEAIPVYDKGTAVGEVCPDEARAQGFVILDLSEDWAPRVFGGDAAAGPAPYREHFVRMAREQLGHGAMWDREQRDRYFELYGVSPSFGVLAARLGDEERHACHSAISVEGLEALTGTIDTWRDKNEQRADRLQVRRLKQKLNRVGRHLGKSREDLAKDPRFTLEVRAHEKLSTRVQAIRDMQHRLMCEELLGPKAEAGILDNATIDAMHAYFRRHMIVAWQLDDEVRDVLLTDSRELDYRQVLRALRERVVDATGIIEDGSTSTRSTVLGRTLEAHAFRAPNVDGPMPGGAPDLVSVATEEAARGLGWIDPSATQDALSNGLPTRVALRLSPPPDYHAKHMDLHAVVDRGDVVYDLPTNLRRKGEAARRERLPHVVLYARAEGREIPLIRWPTTVGGWQPEWLPERRQVMLTYKESYPGPRVWRDLVVEPRWIPPETTPERDLVRPSSTGDWIPRLDTFGPGYASAYGLVMLMHHRVDGKAFIDQGIRTHGSASYSSILEGYSHGCHRLHNHRALRLTGFLLAHRNHVVRGPIPVGYVRSFNFHEQPVRLEFESRGYRYELDPPVDVDVTRGRIVGTAQKPLPPQKLPDHMIDRYRFADDD